MDGFTPSVWFQLTTDGPSRNKVSAGGASSIRAVSSLRLVENFRTFHLEMIGLVSRFGNYPASTSSSRGFGRRGPYPSSVFTRRQKRAPHVPAVGTWDFGLRSLSAPPSNEIRFGQCLPRPSTSDGSSTMASRWVVRPVRERPGCGGCSAASPGIFVPSRR